MTDEAHLAAIKRVYCKTQNIIAMMKKGEFIIAHEKLGGVMKNLDQIGVELERRLGIKKPLEEVEVAVED